MFGGVSARRHVTTPAAATRLALRTSASEWVRLASFLTPSDHEGLSSTLRTMRKERSAESARTRRHRERRKHAREDRKEEEGAYPERVPQRDVLLAGDGLLVFARLRPRRERHRVHQPLLLALLALQLLRHLNQVCDVVSEVTNVRQRVHRARRRLGPAPLGF